MANNSFLNRISSRIFGERQPVKPTQQQGVPGFTAFGGYLAHPERNSKLMGENRWETASDILTNISIVAASLRFLLNLVSRPAWSFKPADESSEAQKYAELMQEIIEDMDGSWSATVRRMAMYRYHGFGMHEWITKKRDDGKIGLAALEVRPVHTIRRWDLDEGGKVKGVWQRDPQSGQEFYLPRRKVVYLVDSAMTDYPDGMGWFRHLVDPAERIKSLLALEASGFERDMRGIPVGRAPMQRLNELQREGKLTAEQVAAQIQGMQEFVTLQRKSSETGLVLDSSVYLSKTDSGQSPSSTYLWDIDLLTGDPGSLEELGKAIERLAGDMALIMGTEVMLTGHGGGSGSRALSEDKSRNLYLNANAMLGDIAEATDSDLVSVIWSMNGFPEEMKPKASPEDVSYKDVKEMTEALADMASAGAVLPPDDPAFDVLRDLMGLPKGEPIDPKMLAAMQGQPAPGAAPQPGRPGAKPGAAPAKPGAQAGAAPPKPGEKQPTKVTPEEKRVGKAAPRPLYVSRKLLNAAALIKWAKSQGFAVTVPAEEMHVTVLYSRNPVDPIAMGQPWPSGIDQDGKIVVSPGGPRVVERLGNSAEPAIVLSFACQELEWRHDDMIARGASHDWQGYVPHVTITYSAPRDFDIDAIEPYQGELIFGPEVFEDLNLDWKDSIVEKGGIRSALDFFKYSPDQPRAPKGESEGGQWTDDGGVAAGSFATSGDGDQYFTPEAFDEAQNIIDRGNKAAVAYMHPRDFIALSAEGHDVGSQSLVDSVLASEGKFNSLPELKFHFGGPNNPRVQNHDGRHRARALLALGVTEMPVLMRGSSLNKGGAGDWRNGSIKIEGERRDGAFLSLPVASVAKYNPNQPRDPRGSPTGGQWTSTGAASASPSVMFEVAPNPDDKELTERWNSLSPEQRQAITEEVAKEVTPKVLEHLGVEGELVPTIGGFEGNINPGFELRLADTGAEIPAASYLGDALAQKSMVIASARPMPGLDPVGVVGIQVPAGERNHAGVSAIFEKASAAPGVDGFTYRNGQIEILNFTHFSDSPISIDQFAKNVDSALNDSYRIKQSTIYSTLLEADSYASGKGDSGRVSGGDFSDSLRQSVGASLERRLQAFGKRAGEGFEELSAEALKYNPDQPRAPKGTVAAGAGPMATTAATRAKFEG